MNNVHKDNRLQRARSLHERGDLTGAVRLYREILRKSPRHVEAMFLLGTACMQSGDFAQAISLLEHVLRLQPQHCEAMSNLGLGMMRSGKPEAALPLLEQALALNPGFVDAWENYSAALEACNRLNEAEFACRKLLELQPDRGGGYSQLGLILMKLERREEAEVNLLRSLECGDSNRAEVLSDLGVLYHESGKLEESVFHLRLAIELEPGLSRAHNTLAACLQEMGDAYFLEALEEYKVAANLMPNEILPQWNAVLLQLQLGQLEIGWDGYELRWLLESDSRRPSFLPWQGESLSGCSILVYPEQGVGDELLFASCLPDLIQLSLHVGIVCDDRLAQLYSRSFPDATVYGGREPGNENWSIPVADVYDYSIAIGSLPRYFRRSLEDFPSREGYLIADPKRVEYWRAWLSQQAGSSKLVGLCWRSGLRSGVRHRLYTSIEDCEPLLRMPDILWINLQYDECREELQIARERFGATILECPGLDLRNNLDEQAALIAALDIVVSAPTAVAELAAAIGVPVLRQGRGWTSLGTDYMPWHPTMQIFPRSSSVSSWGTVIAAMTGALVQTLSKISKRKQVEPVRLGADRCVKAALKVMEAGHRQEALRLCASALTQDAGHAEAWYLQGVLLSRCGDVVAAIDSLTRAIAGNPLESSIYLARAGAQEAKGDLQAAMMDYQLARALDASSTEADAAISRLASLAVDDMDVKKMKLDAWRKALELEPQNEVLTQGYRHMLADIGHEGDEQASLVKLISATDSTEEINELDAACDNQIEAGLAWTLATTKVGLLLTESGSVPDEKAEPVGFAHVRGLLQSGNTVLLVGSGNGVVALACAHSVGESGLVLVLEGRAVPAAMLGASFVLNGMHHALVETVDASGEQMAASQPQIAHYQRQFICQVIDRVENCDLVWIEHPQPLQVLGQLQPLIARCKPFLYVIGLQPDVLLVDWSTANAYAYIVCPIIEGVDKPRSDLLLHPAV